MSTYELILRSHTIVLPYGILDGWIGIVQGKIVALGAGDPANLEASSIEDLRPYVILPGIIDTHVHIRFPGHPEREDFLTGSAAAAAGGVTTILEMPISVPPTWNVDLFQNRVSMAQGHTRVDMGFYAAGGYQAAPHIAELAEAGAIGYKIFLHRPQKGREAEFEGLWAVETGHIYRVFEEIAKTGLKACVHAEDDELLQYAQAQLEEQGRTDPMAHVDGHPLLAETLSIQRAIMIAEDTGTRLSICHISSGTGANLVRQAKARGVSVTAETCPHYLVRVNTDMSHYGAYAKINPPLRSREEQSLLWAAVKDGTIDFIGSDHAPYTREEKERGGNSIWAAPAGCPGLETSLPVLLESVTTGVLNWVELSHLMATKASEEFGLRAKGSIELGKDADFAIVSLEERTLLAPRMLTKSRDTAMLYNGQTVAGSVAKTYVRGTLVFDQGKVVGDSSYGEIIRAAR